MLVIVFFWTVLGVVIAKDEPVGYIFSSASVIKLDSNEASYTVGCSLNDTAENVNSHHLTLIETFYRKLKTTKINDTTIAQEVNLQFSRKLPICEEKGYYCKLKDTMIGSIAIYVVTPPRPIKRSSFNCISKTQDFFTCSFKRLESCLLSYTNYTVRMSIEDQQWDCDVTVEDYTLVFNSSSCNSNFEFFSDGGKNISFLFVVENIAGKSESSIIVDSYDILKPSKPSKIQVPFVNSSSLQATWNMSEMFLNLDRIVEFEFRLHSKCGKSISYENMTFEKGVTLVHQFGGLHAFTDYQLKIRARIVPRSVRYELKYWSDWSSVKIRTKACRPYQAPRTAPGAYSFKEKRNKLANLEVYLEPVPKCLHNGPGFGFEVYAISESGQRLNASHPALSNGVATFRNIKADERYTVYLDSYNNEGWSEEVSYIFIYPSDVAYEPKIKRVLKSKHNYHLQWLPVSDPEHLSNYTILHCPFSAMDTCENSIRIVSLPPNVTSYSINSTKYPNFALAANYRFFSSELHWMQCILHTRHWTFKLTDETEHSVTLRLSQPCSGQSMIKRYEVRYWPKMYKRLEKHITNGPNDMVITIDDLDKNTEYVVNVTVYDNKGIPYKESQTFRTSDNDFLQHLILLLLFGILVITIVTNFTVRRVKKMMNIKVEITMGLQGIFDMPMNCTQTEGSCHVNEKIVPKDELFSISLYDQDNLNETMQSDLVELILNQPEKDAHDEPPLLPEQLESQKSYDQDDSDEEVQPMIIKSILKKPNEATHDKRACLPNQLERKNTIQIMSGTDYIQPSQLKVQVKQDLSGNHLNSLSGYVLANLTMKQRVIDDDGHVA